MENKVETSTPLQKRKQLKEMVRRDVNNPDLKRASCGLGLTGDKPTATRRSPCHLIKVGYRYLDSCPSKGREMVYVDGKPKKERYKMKSNLT